MSSENEKEQKENTIFISYKNGNFKDLVEKEINRKIDKALQRKANFREIVPYAFIYYKLHVESESHRLSREKGYSAYSQRKHYMPILGKYINEKCRKLVNDFIDLSSDKSDTIDANRMQEFQGKLADEDLAILIELKRRLQEQTNSLSEHTRMCIYRNR